MSLEEDMELDKKIGVTVLHKDARSISSSSSHSSGSAFSSISQTSSVESDTDESVSDQLGKLPPTIVAMGQNNAPGAFIAQLLNTKLFNDLCLPAAEAVVVNDESAFQQSIAIHHYHHGQISTDGLGLSKAAALKSAKARLTSIILEAERDLHAPLLSLPPPQLILTTKAAAIAATQNHHLRQLQEMGQVYNNGGVVCIDIESWDQSTHDTVLEVGIVTASVKCLWQPDNDFEMNAQHFIVEENLHKRNGSVAGGRRSISDKKFSFLPELGHSEILSQPKIVQRIQAIISAMREQHSHIFLLGHSIDGDIKWLRDVMGIDVSDLSTLDVAEAFAAIEGRRSRRKLSFICDQYGVETKHLHNGGNDAVFTQRLCKKMAQDLVGTPMVIA